MNIVYLNGQFLPENEAKISIFDRGFIFGDGIYEVLPVIDGKIVDVEGFWERFSSSLKKVELKLPMNKEEFLSVLNTLVKKNSLHEGGVYTQITRGVDKRSYPFPKNIKPTCMAFCYKSEIINHPYKNGIEAVSVKDIRWKRRDIKSVSLLAQCIAKEEAVKKGAFEGLMVENEMVSEGVTSTAYIVKNNTIITTPLTEQILPGIRRKNILKLCEKLGIKVEFRHFSIDEVKNADEAFISSATIVILPIIKIDGHTINGAKIGNITKKLREMYIQKLHEEARNS